MQRSSKTGEVQKIWEIETGGSVFSRVVGRKKEWIFILNLDKPRFFAFIFDKVKIQYGDKLCKVFKDRGRLRDDKGKAIKPYGRIICKENGSPACDLRVKFLGETEWSPYNPQIRKVAKWLQDLWFKYKKLPVIRVWGWILRGSRKVKVKDEIPLLPAKLFLPNKENNKVEYLTWGNQHIVFVRDAHKEYDLFKVLQVYEYIGSLEAGAKLDLEGHRGRLHHKIKIWEPPEREISVSAKVNTKYYYKSNSDRKPIIEVYRRLGSDIEYLFLFNKGGRIILYSDDHKRDGMDRILISGQQCDVVVFWHKA